MFFLKLSRTLQPKHDHVTDSAAIMFIALFQLKQSLHLKTVTSNCVLVVFKINCLYMYKHEYPHKPTYNEL
jgi:hypothetical protein